MARAEIYINSTLADYEKLDLSFVYACEDDNLGVSGSHSKRTIKLPATKTNNEIFDNAIRIQLPQNLSIGLLTMPCRILVDGLVVFIGKCQVDKSTISRLNSNYEVLFLADNSDWIEEFRNVGLDQIPMPTAIDYTGQNVLDFYGGHNKFDGFCFFLPKTAEWQRTGSVRTDEYYPAIFLDYIFRTGWSNIGYTIKSGFMDTTFWSGLILPVLCRNYDTEYLKGKLLTEMGGLESIPAVGFNLAYFTNIVSNSVQTTTRLAGGLYTVFKPIVNGKFRFFGYYGTNLSSINPFYARVNGVQTQLLNNTHIDLVIGDEVWFLTHVLVPGETITTSTLKIDYVSLVNTANVPNVTIGNYYPFNALYELNQLASKWQLLDIIKDIQKAFNLVFVTDAVKKEVTIEPRDYWISAADGVLFNGNGIYSGNEDITAKVDVSKDILQEYNSDEERYISINYKEDDPTVKAFEAEREGIKLYSYQFDRGARFKNGEKQVNLEFFNKCMHIIDSEINPTSTSHLADYQLPLLYGKNWYETPRGFFPDYDNLTPYLLWFYGNYNPVYPPNEGASGISVYDPITNYSARRGFPLAFITLYNDYSLYSDYSANLSFSKEGYSHSLVSDFHYRDFERKTNNVKVTAYVNWSNIDIFNLDFKKKYILNESTMLLKSVDGYNPLSGTTTKTVLQLDGRLMSDEGETGTEENESKLKGLIVI
jgi:hypothetical protein